MHYVHVLYNNRDNELYIGCTNDLKRRIKEHSIKMPELLYYEAYQDKRDAKERKLKQRGQSVRWLKHRLKYSINIKK